MDTLDRLVPVYLSNTAQKNVDEADAIVKEITQNVQSDQIKLLEIVKALGEHLTGEDAALRSRSILLLSSVLAALPNNFLSLQHVEVMTQFYSARLDDEPSTIELLTGLNALQQMRHFGDDEAEQVIEALFLEVKVQTQPQGARFLIWALIDGLMTNQRKALKKMGARFVKGLIKVMQGEKDPRNLMIAFSVMKVVLVEWEIEKHVEELFDVTYCYFPIMFKPPPDDPYGITADDLKQRLRECLSATPLFATELIPALLDKLSSTSPSVKKDTLLTLLACSNNFGPRVIASHSITIWDAVKYEVTHADDEHVAEVALELIAGLTKCLSQGVTELTRLSSLTRYLKNVTAYCAEELKDPGLKRARPAGRILAACAGASHPANQAVVEAAVPNLLVMYAESGEIAKQAAILAVLIGLMDSAGVLYGYRTDSEAAPEDASKNPQLAFKERYFHYFGKALMGTAPGEVGLRKVAMKGLSRMARLRDFLDDGEIGLVVQYLDGIVIEIEDGEGSADVAKEALSVLEEITTFRPELILDITFPAFMAQLPDTDADTEGASKPKKHYKVILAALAQLSSPRALFEVLLTRLLNKLEVIIKNGTSSVVYPQIVLSTILLVLRKKSTEGAADLPTYFDRLVPTLLTKTLVPFVQSGNEQLPMMCRPEILKVSSQIINIVFRSLNTQKQESVVKELFAIFVDGQQSQLIASDNQVVAEKFPKLHEPGQANTIILFTAAISSLRKEVKLPVDDLEKFLSVLVQQVETTSSELTKISLLKLIASIVNKSSDESLLNKVMSGEVNKALQTIKTGDAPSRRRALDTLLWIGKAFVAKTHKSGTKITSDLIDLLVDPLIGSSVANGFGVLIGDDETLSKENHATIRLLQKQRFFSFAMPELMSRFKSAQAGDKSSYLVAVTNIIRHVPKQVLLPDLPGLLPVLIQALGLVDPELKGSAIDTLYVTILDASQTVSEHLSTLVPLLMESAMVSEVNTMRVRISTLRCLSVFPSSFRREMLQPFKNEVIMRLGRVLEDPKRVVRKEAVDCRHKWYSM
ncbi:ARM repeat-containing protein [Saitoella complicata NRRL Y-17804]|uniref:MMS19 nucleotide excision repair protein n=1 Tax=Saitoella complicata (strain BCRC 22490 / CBS 7301 / JCM 7358 / NBRC 10748 / NRRL Y-17804) TaxID=698492 RepID=A0A0E9NPG8_SAICN|nr:ARM repeat-containing protein [Saitoella complicata NRRL Y-17804]ODQ52358.1 ARM repeat-containing protein [Saitoella complicata NRRL Y-17804]GAO51729.1 hypothetical protein G7K_5822-t1 [Saitoella complicata NRRL Y-17804]